MAQIDKYSQYEDTTSDKYSQYEDKSVQAKPTKESETPKGSFSLGDAWNWAISPLTDAPTRAAKGVADKIDKPSLKRPVGQARLEGFLAGATEGLGNVVSSLTSPLNLATMGAGSAESIAVKQGAPLAAKYFNYLTKALSTPIAGEGAKHTYEGVKEGDYGKAGFGIAEAAGSIAGVVHSVPNARKAVAPPEQKMLPEGRGYNVTPEGVASPSMVVENGPISRREALKRAAEVREEPRTFEVEKTGKVKEVKTAQDYIKATKDGTIPKGTSFDDFKELDELSDDLVPDDFDIEPQRSSELRDFLKEKVSNFIKQEKDRFDRIDKLTDAYEKQMPKAYEDFTGFSRPFHVYDVGQRFSPEELSAFLDTPSTKKLGQDISYITDKLIGTISDVLPTKNLERVGFILDEKTKGIWVPNPKTGKSAVLINPFELIQNNSPDGAAAGIVHSIFHEFAHLVKRTEDEPFAYVLSGIVDKFGARNAIEAQSKIYETLTGESLNGPAGSYVNRGYTPEVSQLLQQYKESRGRKFTSPDALSGEAAYSRSTGKGQDGDGRNTEPRPRSSYYIDEKGYPRGEKGRFAANYTVEAVGKLKESLAAAIPLRQKQENIYHQGRSERFGKFASVKTKGFAGYRQRMSALKGEFEKVEVSPLELSAKETDTLFDTIMFSKKLTPGEKARGGTALAKLINGDAVPQKGELAILDHVFGGGFAEDIIMLHGGLGAASIRLGKTANTMKSMLASLDLSAPFRQGIGLVHRGEFWASFRDMFKYAASHDAFTKLNESLEERPTYLLGRKSGLFLAGEELAGREERFLNSYLNDLSEAGPIGSAITSPFKASERAYVGFLNKLRADTFDNMVQAARDAGHSLTKDKKLVSGKTVKVINPIFKDIANYVNVSTGRGGLGKLGKIGDELNLLFFSPRLMTSRLTILNPMYYINASPFVRKEALKTLLSITTFIGMANGVGKMAFGGDLEGDSRNSDFGKVRFGQTRLDPGGGILQYLVLASRIGRQSTVSSTSGKETKFGSSMVAPNTYSVLFGDSRRQGFIETKLAPMAALVDKALRGQDFEGNDIDIKKEILKSFIPIMVQDAIELAKENPEYLPLLIPTAFGMSEQTYQPRQKKNNGAFRAPSAGSLRP